MVSDGVEQSFFGKSARPSYNWMQYSNVARCIIPFRLDDMIKVR